MSFVPAADSSQLRTSPASSAQRCASIDAMTLHSNSAEALRTAGGAGPGVTGGAAAAEATQTLFPQACSARSPRTGPGRPLDSHETILKRLRTTRTATGLRVRAHLLRRTYKTDVKEAHRKAGSATGAILVPWGIPPSEPVRGRRTGSASHWRKDGADLASRRTKGDGRQMSNRRPGSTSPSMNQHPGSHQRQGESQNVGILKHTPPMQTHV